MAQNISQAIGGELNRQKKNEQNLSANLRVAVPGIIQAFDSVEQTVRVQPAIRELVTGSDYTPVSIPLPELLDVPIVLPRAGAYVITLPIQAGDECLVIFADQCVDAWWQNGGVQNQMEKRRHDLSDGFAILGTWSQPRRLSQYRTDSMQLLNLETGAGIRIDGEGVTIQGKLTVNGESIMEGALVAGGVDLVDHIHICPDGQTGGPQ